MNTNGTRKSNGRADGRSNGSSGHGAASGNGHASTTPVQVTSDSKTSWPCRTCRSTLPSSQVMYLKHDVLVSPVDGTPTDICPECHDRAETRRKLDERAARKIAAARKADRVVLLPA